MTALTIDQAPKDGTVLALYGRDVFGREPRWFIGSWCSLSGPIEGMEHFPAWYCIETFGCTEILPTHFISLQLPEAAHDPA